MSKDLKFSKECLLEKIVNLILGIINIGVSCKSAKVISKLCRLYVKPHLTYWIQFWTPINVKDADMLKGLQRRATKRIQGLRNLLYKERWKRLGMFSLRCRRLRIEVFKMIHDIDKVNLENNWIFAGGRLVYID